MKKKTFSIIIKLFFGIIQTFSVSNSFILKQWNTDIIRVFLTKYHYSWSNIYQKYDTPNVILSLSYFQIDFFAVDTRCHSRKIYSRILHSYYTRERSIVKRDFKADCGFFAVITICACLWNITRLWKYIGCKI